MRRSFLFFVWCLAISGMADVVTEPLRRYGLGELVEVAISPDRSRMATAGRGGAFIWDFQSGTVLHRLEGHHAQVSKACFSPDNQLLLTGGRDRVIRAWDVQSGLEVRSFHGHPGEIMNLAFAPDGESFVSAGGSARVWSLATGDLLHSLVVTSAFISRAVFTPEGNRVVTSTSSVTNDVRVWDLATGQTIRSFGSQVSTLAFVADGRLITGGQDLAVNVWDIEKGQVIRELPGATQVLVNIAGSTNSSAVIAGCADGRIITWDASTGVALHNFVGERLVAMAAIPGTNQVLTGHTDNLVRVKKSDIGDNLRVFGGHTTSTTSGVGFSPDGRYVVSGGVEVFTRLWNRTNAQQVNMFPGHGAGTEAVSFSPDGTSILTTFGAPVFSAQLWNVATGLIQREYFGHTGWLLDAVFSPNGQRIATGAQDGTARLWDTATGAQIRSFPSPGTWVRAVAVSSNGTLLASGSSDGVARLWNTANAQLLHSFDLNAGSVVDVAFSPATGDLLVAWADGFIRLFDPVTGELKLDSVTLAAFLEAATFSPDGRFILGGEGWPFFTARLWDARNGAELRVFAGHADPVTSVAFNSTSTSILTGSDIVRLWSIADIAARLESNRNTNGIELRWHTGQLQHASHVVGPWTDATNAASPWLVPRDQSAAFFRVKAPTAE